MIREVSLPVPRGTSGRRPRSARRHRTAGRRPTFAISYGTATLHLPRSLLLVATLVAAAVEIAVLVVFGRLAERLGPARVCIVGGVASALAASGERSWSLALLLLVMSTITALGGALAGRWRTDDG